MAEPLGMLRCPFFESSPASECSVGMQLGACLLFVRLNWAQERYYYSHSREKSNNRFGELLPPFPRWTPDVRGSCGTATARISAVPRFLAFGNRSSVSRARGKSSPCESPSALPEIGDFVGMRPGAMHAVTRPFGFRRRSSIARFTVMIAWRTTVLKTDRQTSRQAVPSHSYNPRQREGKPVKKAR